MNVVNYQKELDRIIEILQQERQVPKVLLHSCCAPCSSYCLEYLSEYFSITVFYYNPNIYPEEEYRKRVIEQQQFIKRFPAPNPISFIEGEYDPKLFYETVKGLESCREGTQRCFACYRMRLEEAAKIGKQENCDYFTTTLSISPLKNAVKLNEIGGQIALEYDIAYLPSDFKKRNGYQRSIILSKEYQMYRQDYCGCIFSLKK